MVTFQILTCFALLAYGKSVPPQVCFEPFNWGDCGRPPVHVLYYYKSGSRCEVGVWRGCLPNLNMFSDEYECVNTCVFAERAQADDFHMAGGEEVLDELSIDEPPTALNTSSAGGDEYDYDPINSVSVDDLDKPTQPPADMVPPDVNDPTVNTTDSSEDATNNDTTTNTIVTTTDANVTTTDAIVTTTDANVTTTDAPATTNGTNNTAPTGSG